MVLHGTVKMPLDACYEFTITSDDGSRLWIDEHQVLNNDGGHEMRTKVDSFAIKQGNYDTKLWYFQGLPTRFGIIMDAKTVGKYEDYPKIINKKETDPPPKIITLRNILFDLDQYDLNIRGRKEIEEALAMIRQQSPSKIIIIGHTDNLGVEVYNQNLSLKRAQSVKNELSRLLNELQIEFHCIGQGSEIPIASNLEVEGRHLNRRVELIIK